MILLLLGALASGLAPTWTAAPALGAPDGTTPLRVMLVGDSLTHGHTGSATYRYWLWREFRRQQVPVTFVGPDTDLVGPADWYEHSDQGFEKHHAAQGGSRFSFHLPLVEKLVTAHRPDVIVLLLGINGAGQTTPGLIAEQTLAYLARAWAIDPEIRFVVGEIPGSDSPSRTDRANEITLAANGLVAQRLAHEPRVALARIRSSAGRSWDPARHTVDGTHPNATGETLLAQHFGEALSDLNVLQRPVRAYHEELWQPQVRPTVRLSGNLLTVSWESEAARAGLTRAQVLVRRASGGHQVRTGWLRTLRYRTRLARGRYTVQLVPGRMRMTGVPIRPVPVHVRSGAGRVR